MGRYDNDENYSVPNQMRSKDLVLASNEFAFVSDRTSGSIRTYSGPTMLTISQQQNLVIFNAKTKKFEEVDFDKAKQLFVTIPEGWYSILKNPAKDNRHPEVGPSNTPELLVGKKIVVSGPASFSLYPGQMYNTIQGHRLRTNQYLIARVYDADAANNGAAATVVDVDGNEIKKSEKYYAGQLLVIKGTEVSFYIPKTGIEVIPDETTGNYIRDAVTLERLEYVILKDENGSKNYVPGPAVVFPTPTETFVEANKKHEVIFRALELSPISGIYVKVIADYVDENGVEHKVGEELFITGNEQMIFYPRPELALIQYDGRYMHHAIAIPKGEGRYVLDRLTGKIKTVVGPAMYLPDPRTEVVVKRKLSTKECKLFYPNNEEVLSYNETLSETAVEKLARTGKANAITDAINTAYSTASATDSLAIFEATANISRGVSYTKPRTITLDTKFDGVVSIDVWSGYAICVISKSGKKEVVVGPTTRLLDYDETLQTINTSEGEVVFLKLENNKITDTIMAQTEDHVDVQIKLAYNIDFKNESKKWFEVTDYINCIKDYMRNIIKIAVKKNDIQTFYADATEIIRKAVLNEEKNIHTFKSNNAIVNNVEILGMSVERAIVDILNKHKEEILSKNIELADADAKMKVVQALAEVEKKEIELEASNKLYKAELEQKITEDKMNKDELIKVKMRAMVEAENKAKADMQEVLAAINEATIAREKAQRDAEIEYQKSLAKIEEDKQKAYATTVVEMLNAIQPGFIEALQGSANAELVNGIGNAISPYAMANGESVADAVTTLLRGTSLEKTLKIFAPKSE